ncbi:RNA 2',3'-cyclic phosphodiesterase [Sunxiuqinia indica]|uniref:RNA 2',3'-cyclic phosphodiesterase n=1 Tax=Sunxiuqinia indica TaxID=2692584 RepID=UPI00135C4026|nr:RNA 2',3'-cyclic phosphodiesterase [Sunxiuqinia indica]
MMKTKRVFIAVNVELNCDLERVFQELKDELEGERIRWVPENNFHITLRFIGDLQPDQIEIAKLILDQVCSQRRAFGFKLHQVGFFKHRGNPSVLFFNLDHVEDLICLSGIIQKRLDEKGISSNKKFTPHLTLARIKKIKGLSNFYHVVDKYKEIPTQEIKVDRIVFYESVLKPSGAEYHVLDEYRLS